MRLRNLYELKVEPGQRKGFSLGLKRIEDIQLQLAEMQQAIDQLGYTNVPGVLKQQIAQLIDSAVMEKEKIYASLSQKNKKVKDINGIPSNILKLLKGIDKNCSTIMNAYRNHGKFLYRGINSSDDALYGKPFEERRNMSSNKKLTDILNKAMSAAGYEARRDNTSFTSGDINHAGNYGSHVYIFFPKDGFHFHYSKGIRDLVLGSDKIHLLIDNNIKNNVKKVIAQHWTAAQQYFNCSSATDVFSGYGFEDDVRRMQEAVQAGVLPSELSKYNGIADFSTPEAVVQNMEFDKENLDAAIASKHEVLFTGPYYGLRNDKFRKYVEQYLNMTRNGTLDSTPDTDSEDSKLSDIISKELGQKPSGFEVGDWISHSYDKDIMGQVVNNFYTNDFLQIKNYDDKLKLVHKSNAKVIPAPEVPDYQIGDKVLVNTAGLSNYQNYDNVRGRIIAIGDSLLTIKYKNVYGDSNTIDIPKIFTKLLPKFDAENPEVGDTVYITDGTYEGFYGELTSFGGYGSPKVKLDGDGSVVTVYKNEFKVIDPADKKEPKMPEHIKDGDYVEISDESTEYPGFVGKIIKLGVIMTAVRINNTSEQSIGTVHNKHLATITEEEFKARRLMHETPVLVINGPAKGRIGNIVSFYSNGTVEIYDTNPAPGKSSYVDTSIKNIVKQDSEQAKNFKFDPDTQDNKTFEYGDYVRIEDGADYYPSAVGLVIGDTFENKTKVKVYGDSNLIHSIGNFYLTKIQQKEYASGMFKMDDDVTVIKGPYDGKSGIITDILSNGKLRVKINANNPDNEYVIKAPADHFEKQYVDLDLEFDDIQDFDTASSNKPAKMGDFKVGDVVTVQTGEEKGNTGTITGVMTYGYDVKMKNTGYISYYLPSDLEHGYDDSLVDLDWEPLEDPVPTPKVAPTSSIDPKKLKFKIGDGANATNANKKVKGWTIVDYNDKGVVMKNNASGTTMTRPWNLFYKANPNYDPDEPEDVNFFDLPTDDEGDNQPVELKVGDEVNAIFAGGKKGWKVTGTNEKGVQAVSNSGHNNTIPWKTFFNANPQYKAAMTFDDGDHVMVTKGPFEGFAGTIVNQQPGDHNEYSVSIEIFGKKNNVDLPGHFLKIEKDEDTGPADAPKVELDQDKIKQMTDDAKQSGYITYSKLNKIIPPEVANAEQVEDLMNTFNELGINVIDDSEEGITQPTGDTPTELKARVSDPDNKKELLGVLRSSSNVKLLVKNAVDSKFISYSITIAISVLVGADTFNNLIKPYLELKGVKFSK